MKALFRVIFLLLSASSFAAAGEKPPLTVQDVISIHNAAQVMSCVHRVLRDGGKETLFCEPFGPDKLKTSLAWQIAELQSSAAPVVQKYQRARNLMLASYSRRPDGTLTQEEQARFLAAEADLLDSPAGVDLPRFKRSDIEPLNLAPPILAAIMPLIDHP